MKNWYLLEWGCMLLYCYEDIILKYMSLADVRILYIWVPECYRYIKKGIFMLESFRRVLYLSKPACKVYLLKKYLLNTMKQ